MSELRMSINFKLKIEHSLLIIIDKTDLICQEKENISEWGLQEQDYGIGIGWVHFCIVVWVGREVNIRSGRVDAT
jgi:hypothetical protein